MIKRDVVVIGGGAGGLVSASGLAQLGLKVTLIEKQEKLGGDCLHYGCIPSKTFIHSAKVAHLMRRGDDFGVGRFNESIDLSQVNQTVQRAIDTIAVHDDPKRFESMGVEVIFGPSKFIDKQTIEVAGKLIQAKRFILAMGSRPYIPNIPGLESIDYLTNETIFNLKVLPEHLLILGAGAIGVELGQAFARLGSKVTLLETNARLIHRLDRNASDCLQSVFDREGITCAFNVDFKKIEKQDKKIIVRLQQNNQSKTIEGSHLLVATGRKANVEGLDLEVAGVKVEKRGIKVNKKLKTSNRKIYAVGDVVDSPFKFTHMAEYHAGIAIANIAFKMPKKVSEKIVPSVVFSDPEIAQVGQSEYDLNHKKVSFETLNFDFKDNDRAIAQSETDGFAKFFIKKGKILGAVMTGPSAGELLGEVTLAMQANISIGQISATIHAYPTLSQIIRRCVNQHYAPKLFSAKTRKLVRFLQYF